MASIQSVNSNIPSPMAKIGSVDSDGDKDGTAKSAPSTPPITTPSTPKPTATMGNNVNTYA